MPEFPAISGVDDADQARVALVQGKQIVHAPLTALGFQPLDAGLTDIAGLAVTDGNFIVGDGTHWVVESGATARASLGLGSAATKELTSWVAYTPTFTGLGTATAVFIESKRQGDDLLIRGKFTSGTATAVEARMTLGFNGVNGGITSDAVKVPTIQLAGLGTYSVNAASTPTMLIESNVGYITFGLQSSTTNGMAKLLGTGFGSTVVMNFFAAIPISGW